MGGPYNVPTSRYTSQNWTSRYTSQNWTSRYTTSRYTSENSTSRYMRHLATYTFCYTRQIIYISFEIDLLEGYNLKDLVKLSRIILKLMGLDAFGQCYEPLKLIELNSGSIFKGFYFGPESRYTNKFVINRFRSMSRGE
jgi:hypothetical protein